MPARRDPGRLPDRWDVERAVKESEDLHPIEKHLMLDLCTYMDQGTTVLPYRWSPSLTGLGKDTNWSRRTITRHLKQLEIKGWLVRIRPTVHNARTRHMRTAYTVIIPAELGTAGAQARGYPSPDLGTASAQARGYPSPDLGTEGPEARATPRLNPEFPDQPDLSEEIAAVVKFLEERTGVRVSAEWAAKTAAEICSRPGIKNRLSYVIRTIVTDPNPQRWLPTPTPPPFTQQEEAS